MTTSNGTEPSQDAPTTGDPTFISTLKEGHQRFLAHAIEHSFVCGRRTAQDFIRHFPPSAIMKGLEHHAELRASILVLTTGLKQKIALKKEWEDAATDLQIALDEGETDAESIVALFESDDRVRYLDPQRIWAFLTEGDFWRGSSNKALADIARNHVAFLLERALEDKLITHRDVVEGVTVEELANRLPKAELGRLISCALQNADKGTFFTESDLLATTPPRVLVQHVPLAHLWDAVIVPRVAQRHGYAPMAQAPAVQSPAPQALAAQAAAATAASQPQAAKPAAELPKPPAQEASSAPKDVSVKPAAASRVATPPKEASKVKLKAPAPEQAAATAPGGPSVHKAPQPFFGDESDDIEVIEDEVKAV